VLVEELLDLVDEGELLGRELEVHDGDPPAPAPYLTGRQIRAPSYGRQLWLPNGA